MNTVIEHLNLWGEHALGFVWPMLWQSSLLIVSLFVLDIAMRRKMRAAVRYALWLVVGVKLLLPPSFALPSGLGWWVRHAAPVRAELLTDGFVVTYRPGTVPSLPAQVALPDSRRPWRPSLSMPGYTLLGSLAISLALLFWMIIRWRQVSRDVHGALKPSERLNELLVAAQRQSRLRRPVLLRLTTRAMSPAVCGLFRPRILLPQSLAERLSDTQVRAVLLHELFHLKRGDVWVNCSQALIQVCYWWHPLVWFANSRIRQLREEAVDDAVMAALGEEAETYAPTLVEVAKLALARPLTSLGLVGILESRGFLRQRIERLLNFRAPQQAGLTVLSILGILSFAAVALPMGEAPAKMEAPPVSLLGENFQWPDPRFPGYQKVDLDAQFLILDQSSVATVLPSLADSRMAVVVSSNELATLDENLKKAAARYFAVDTEVTFPKFSGGQFRYHVGGVQSNQVDWQTRKAGYPIASSVVTGAKVDCVSTYADWMPLAFNLVPWDENDSIRCQMELVIGGNTDPVPPAEVTIPPGGAVLWGGAVDANPGKYQLVFLRRGLRPPSESNQHQAAQPFSNAIPEVRIELNPDYNNATQTTPIPLSTPVTRPGLSVRTNLLRTSKGREAIYKKLESIRLEEVRFDNLPLSEVISKLSAEAKKHDPTGRGINFIINPTVDNFDASSGPIAPSTGLPVLDVAAVPINLVPRILNVRLCDVLDAVIKVAGKPLEYSIEDYAVAFSAKGRSERALYVRIFNVDRNALNQSLGKYLAPGLTETPENLRQFHENLLQFLATLGVDLTPPKSLYFKDREGLLRVRATLQELDTIELALIELALRPMTNAFVSDDPASPPRSKPVEQQGLRLRVGTNGAVPPAMPLCVRIFKVDTNAFSRALENVNDSQLTNTQARVRQFLAQRGVDLTPPKSAHYMETEGTLIMRATLQDLETIEKSLEQQKIWLRARTNGVLSTNGSLSTRPQEGANVLRPPGQSEAAGDGLLTRVFNLDPRAILTSLQKQSRLPQNPTSEQQQEALQKWLADKGIDLQSPKKSFYNDRDGRLLIHATASDLDKVEVAVMILNLPPPQLNLKVKVIELGEKEADAFWQKFPPPNSASTAAWAVEISASQARRELQQWSATDAKLLNEASITTLSGRRTTLSTTHSMPGPNSLDIGRATKPQGVVAPIVEYFGIGPEIEILSELSEDAYTVKLDVSSSMTNFLGYGDTIPMPSRMDTRLINGDAIQVPSRDTLPVPRFRVDKIVAHAQVRDGQVLALGHPIDPTGAPVQKSGDGQKRLLVFITPTAIDPAGNRLHSDDEVNGQTPK